MQKICPYCGRAGELGSSCQGCGYVLQARDDGIPQAEPAATRSETHTAVHTTSRQNVSPQADQTYQYHEEISKQSTIHNSMQDTNTIARHANFLFTGILRIIGWIVSIPIILFGVIGTWGTWGSYHTSFITGLSNTLLGGFFIILGAVIINLILPPSKKLPFGKQLKYVLLLDFILLIITIIIEA